MEEPNYVLPQITIIESTLHGHILPIIVICLTKCKFLKVITKETYHF